jgi:hypothetical protein
VIGLRRGPLLVAFSDVLDQVLGDVADAAVRVGGAGHDALSVDLSSEPAHVQGSGPVVQRPYGVFPGRERLVGVGVKAAAPRAAAGRPLRRALRACGVGAGPSGRVDRAAHRTKNPPRIPSSVTGSGPFIGTAARPLADSLRSPFGSPSAIGRRPAPRADGTKADGMTRREGCVRAAVEETHPPEDDPEIDA